MLHSRRVNDLIRILVLTWSCDLAKMSVAFSCSRYPAKSWYSVIKSTCHFAWMMQQLPKCPHKRSSISDYMYPWEWKCSCRNMPRDAFWLMAFAFSPEHSVCGRMTVGKGTCETWKRTSNKHRNWGELGGAREKSALETVIPVTSARAGIEGG